MYGDLPNTIAVEKPREVHTCADADHISTRMLKLHEQIGEQYETAAESAVKEQLAMAGARLAAVLNSIWPTCPRLATGRRNGFRISALLLMNHIER